MRYKGDGSVKGFECSAQRLPEIEICTFSILHPSRPANRLSLKILNGTAKLSMQCYVRAAAPHISSSRLTNKFISFSK